MNRKGDKALIVGLDIGTSKVTALVGEYSPGWVPVMRSGGTRLSEQPIHRNAGCWPSERFLK